jgi:asparagine synthetase B (glutamine-hydrolysing)
VALPARGPKLEDPRIQRLTLLPNLIWEGTESGACGEVLAGSAGGPVFGQYALLHQDQDHYYLIRDRLGLNKLFYHLDPDSKTLTVGHYLFEVARATGDYNGVRSVPAGHYLVVDRETLARRLVSYWDLSRVETAADFDLEGFQHRVDALLTRLFVALDRRAGPDARFYVCLSGGLDSTVIAAYAGRYLRNVTAVSFSYERLSDDFRAAERIAGGLGLPFLPVVARRRFEEGLLDDVLRFGQDWRDFNVHCAWVNAHIAGHLRESGPVGGAMVLTGDLMNELVADYTPVEFGGAVYYPQPRIPREKLRRFLVYGLDSSDRETGIFHHHGLTVVQPYSLVAEEYLSVPPEILAMERWKERLNGALLSRLDRREIGDLVLKSKLRAQVGSSDGGTLGLFHEAGITQQKLEERWQALFAPTAREDRLEPVIVGGRYRS